MSEFEHAQEHLEHAAHEHAEHGHGGTSHSRAAVVIAILAAALALTEFAAKDAQTGYLTTLRPAIPGLSIRRSQCAGRF
jgi:hypothetical protein